MIRDLTQAKLEALALWVGAAPAYSVTYPDLETGLEIVVGLLKGRIPTRPPSAGRRKCQGAPPRLH